MRLIGIARLGGDSRPVLGLTGRDPGAAGSA
jgi:hypothetical protein